MRNSDKNSIQLKINNIGSDQELEISKAVKKTKFTQINFSRLNSQGKQSPQQVPSFQRIPHLDIQKVGYQTSQLQDKNIGTNTFIEEEQQNKGTRTLEQRIFQSNDKSNFTISNLEHFEPQWHNTITLDMNKSTSSKKMQMMQTKYPLTTRSNFQSKLYGQQTTSLQSQNAALSQRNQKNIGTLINSIPFHQCQLETSTTMNYVPYKRQITESKYEFYNNFDQNKSESQIALKEISKSFKPIGYVTRNSVYGIDLNNLKKES